MPDIAGLSDAERERFRVALNLLFTESFLVRVIEQHVPTYRFVTSDFNLVEKYLAVFGWGLCRDEALGVIAFQGPPSARLSLSNDESLLLLVLRLLFEEKAGELAVHGQRTAWLWTGPQHACGKPRAQARTRKRSRLRNDAHPAADPVGQLALLRRCHRRVGAGGPSLGSDNGSEKSSVIDAIQYGLVAQVEKIRFNAAASDRRTARSLESYCRCKVSADSMDYPRGGCISHVILEFGDAERYLELYMIKCLEMKPR